MCRFASFVLTKDRVFWLDDSDSHSDIIAHYKIHESGARGLNVVKVEITPTPELTRFEDYDKWKLIFDQDEFPEWHNPVISEERARKALVERAKRGFKRVSASWCSNLTTLNAPEATDVSASGCSNLTTLNAPKATEVYASECTKLTTLNVPEATEVYVSGCSNLTTLNVPEAAYVNAFRCSNLTTLNAPKATEVYASECPKLKNQ